jgi:Protein of unknown function with HXXEE motif
MGTISFDGYRTQWPRVGGVLAMALGGAATLAAKKMSKPQLLSTLNFGALLVHQYEEYQDPGWFPGQFNHGVFKADQPRNYPLNKTTALCINTGLAYPFYIAPVLFPKTKWLGLAPVFFGMSQAVGHGVVFPRIAGDKYSPGFLASFFLHVPLGVTYIRALKAEQGLTRSDMVKGAVYGVAFAAVAVAGPNFLGRNKNSPNGFTAAQMGHHDVVPEQPTEQAVGNTQ